MARAPTVPWTREHLLIALNLYCKLPFGSFDRDNRVIQDVAARMRRSSNSLAMKLCNFASLDPVQQARGIKGLSGASKQDRAIWTEFHSNLDTLGLESEQVLHDLFTKDETREVDFLQRDRVRVVRPRLMLPPTGKTETLSLRRERRGQQFFRQTVLNAYGVRCCITGIHVPRLLVASHIKPWGEFKDCRLDPCNGLCLSSLHDAAFDSGLITLDEKLSLVLSKELKAAFPQDTLENNFAAFEHKPIRSPEKLCEPSQTFLSYHREKIFLG